MTVIAASTGYPLLDVFWTMLWLFLWIIWLFLIIRIVIDIFRSDDLGGWARAGWLIFILILPLIGVLVYLIARGEGIYRREAAQARKSEDAFRDYVRETAGSGRSTADELTKLASLRDQGVITEAEFTQQKAKLLG